MCASRHRFGLIVLALVTPSASAQDQQWGTIKGQVVFGGEKAPARHVIEAAAPVAKVLSDELVVDRQSKGVRWVMVWLLDEKGGNAIPIHPDLKTASGKVVLDQTNNMFDPHVLCLRAGQTLVIKNSSKIEHELVPRFSRAGWAEPSPTVPPVIRPGESREFAGWQASPYPYSIQCAFNRWMSGSMRVFDHPYFAVTNERGEFEIKNAPAGHFRIVVWQESTGWVVREGEKSGKLGIPIEIKPSAVTNLGKIKLQPE